ncbi:MAG: universal stress protein [Proteobacteria bacterium]|nr:universal stress protein [Pseudomonadota bacterium]
MAAESPAPAPLIAVATDFSPHARHAAERAAGLAREVGARLELVHVLPGPPLAQLRGWLGNETALERALKDDAERTLQAQAAQLHAATGADVQPLLAEGSVLDVVLREAEAVDARLLVVGVRGAGFMRRAVLGSTAERLMRKTTRPVLVVRQAPHGHYRRVLVALDFSAGSLATLKLARWLAPRAVLTLATVFELPYENRLRMAGVADASITGYRERCRAESTQRLHALAAQAGLRPDEWQPCVLEGDASFKLVEMEQLLDSELIAVGKHGASMLTDLLLGSVTQHVLAEGQADVLITAQRD